MSKNDLRPPTEAPDANGAVASLNSVQSNSKLWLLLGVVVVILLLVVLVLPAIVPTPNSNAADTAADRPIKDNTAESSEPDKNVQYRDDAEKSLQAFLHARANPELNHVEIWAGEDWHTAMAKADNGDKEFGKGNFFTALNSYQTANSLLQTIAENRHQTLQMHLQTGWQHLGENALEDAKQAFDLALAMQPDHNEARLGLNRTAVRADVLALVITAQQAETTGSLQLAADTYQAVLQLDPLYSIAQERLNQVEDTLRNQAFQNAMGRALQALDNEQFSAAEKALSEATGIYPDSAAINDARNRLSSARRQHRLNSLRLQAEKMAANEDWDGAAKNYQTALGIDPQAAFVHPGLERAQNKQRLHKQLDHYLADPTRLYSDDPLANAQKLLTSNPKTHDDEPILTKKLMQLGQLVTLATSPVELLIVSDNLTQVTVYKIGRLGTFTQKQLSLKPGKYTVTGSRKGYRDVHKVIELKAGMKELSVKVLAEEQI